MFFMNLWGAASSFISSYRCRCSMCLLLGIPRALAMASVSKDGSRAITAPWMPLPWRLSAYSYRTRYWDQYWMLDVWFQSALAKGIRSLTSHPPWDLCLWSTSLLCDTSKQWGPSLGARILSVVPARPVKTQRRQITTVAEGKRRAPGASLRLKLSSNFMQSSDWASADTEFKHSTTHGL